MQADGKHALDFHGILNKTYSRLVV